MFMWSYFSSSLNLHIGTLSSSHSMRSRGLLRVKPTLSLCTQSGIMHSLSPFSHLLPLPHFPDFLLKPQSQPRFLTKERKTKISHHQSPDVFHFIFTLSTPLHHMAINSEYIYSKPLASPQNQLSSAQWQIHVVETGGAHPSLPHSPPPPMSNTVVQLICSV